MASTCSSEKTLGTPTPLQLQLQHRAKSNLAQTCRRTFLQPTIARQEQLVMLINKRNICFSLFICLYTASLICTLWRRLNAPRACHELLRFNYRTLADTARLRFYPLLEHLDLTRDAAALHDEHVCCAYELRGTDAVALAGPIAQHGTGAK